MELKLFLKLIKKYSKIIIVAGILIGLLSAVFVSQLEPTYVATHSVYVEKVPEKPDSGDFTYDGYYAQQAAELYTDTVVGLFESPAVSARALEIAQKNNTAEDVKKFQKKVFVEKVAPRLIEVKVDSKSEMDASALVSGLFQAVNERVEELTNQGVDSLSMSINVVTPNPLIATEEPMVALWGVLGLFLGLLISTSGVMLKEYLLSN